MSFRRSGATDYAVDKNLKASLRWKNDKRYTKKILRYALNDKSYCLEKATSIDISSYVIVTKCFSIMLLTLSSLRATFPQGQAPLRGELAPKVPEGWYVFRFIVALIGVAIFEANSRDSIFLTPATAVLSLRTAAHTIPRRPSLPAG